MMAQKLSGREKATIFLSLLGSETSGRLLRYLPEELAELVASSVNHLPKPSPKTVAAIIEELHSFVSLPPGKAQGQKSGRPTYAAKPPVAQRPEPPVTPPPAPKPEKPKTPKEKFEMASARKLAGVLLYERPQVIAFTLMMVTSEKQIEILSNLPGQRPLVEALLRDFRKNSFTEELKIQVIKYFADKL